MPQKRNNSLMRKKCTSAPAKTPYEDKAGVMVVNLMNPDVDNKETSVDEETGTLINTSEDKEMHEMQQDSFRY